MSTPEPLEPTPQSRTPWKLLCVTTFSIFTLGSYTSLTLYEKVTAFYELQRHTFIMKSIEEDLSKKPISVDINNIKKLSAKDASKDDLLKMLYVHQVKIGQCVTDLNIIKDVLSIPKEQVK